MCPAPSPTKPPVFGLPHARMQGTQWEERGHTRDDSDDSDDDDDNGGKSHTSSGLSSSSSRSRTTQALSSATASWQNDNPDSSQDGVANKGSSKSNSGAIAAGVIVGLVVLAVLTFLWWRRRNGRGLRARTQIEIDPMSSLSEHFFPPILLQQNHTRPRW
ncbi:hypothetical protein GYMLUDRAFT_40681 [Collybiopsis luxurians FD-317 M1]|uniref:Unplaced genomic scaffold GYMLUscaffold_15, whole genome shotgun sequence n=1 Tax=Collybiopsis luxurians FD-317 M1 TaxID=944289 RepID=A0A0D0C677_9AGAR|nr:hypothetical protein GYMLUDRAFT_40681 [Collybiopsis luxurians FD-317 M1]